MNDDRIPIWLWIVFIIVIVVGIMEFRLVINTDLPTWAKWLILS